MKLAARTSRIGESATLRVSRRAGELARQGVEIVDFGAGEPDFASPPVAVEAARRALAEGFTRYTPALGIPRLREALAARYARDHGAPWTAGDVAVTVGAKAALFELALALFDDGDEVVLPSPSWVSFPEQVRFAGARPVPVPTSAADGFRLHAEPLVEAIGPRTRAVLINSPCNPTGGIVGADDLARLAAACAERGVLLVADETYERFCYEPEGHASVAALARDLPETVVLVGSFSKTYAMTGWRLGYLFAPPPVLRAVADVQSHATSNPTSFAMVGALAALEGAEPEVAAMIEEYRARRELLIPRLNALPGVSCRPPSGAFYAFPEVSACFRPRLEDSMAMADYLLEKAGVAVVPGAAFGAEGHIRLSFACSRADLARGVDRMAEALAALTPRV
ncbi:MAG TPA: pyridoxal phosphate-dependent aminotransferase [Thermoanaerobaculia bacterium]|nr:pyridoxal phosphate-dependent aminotransferase [Thermoanaerobaculia bacterium]